MQETTYKSFLKVVLGTISTEALTPPRGYLWPVEATVRPVAESAIVELEHGYLIDPTFDYDTDYPKNQDLLDLEGLDPMARLEEYVSRFEGFLEATLEKPVPNWDEQDVLDFESRAYGWLDKPCDPESFSFRDSARYSPYRVGLDLYEGLSRDVFEKIGHRYIEGDHPGSSFCGVRFEGGVDQLNNALASHGLNLVVRSQQRRV